MKIKSFCIGIILSFFIFGCGVYNKTDFELASNIYQKKSNKTTEIIYIENTNDTIKIFSKDSVATEFSQKNPIIFLKDTNTKNSDAIDFYKNSFDIDFLTIPFKYRPGQKDLPNQFTTNLNGAVYLGRRTDKYKILYTKNPLNQHHRTVKHFGFSYGVFTGFGATAMNPWVTQDKITQEYDGLVWSKGVAGIFGFNNFTAGIAIGFDDLLDKNKNVWIYQQQMWYGLAFGLNIN